jgi:hypothetical protein
MATSETHVRDAAELIFFLLVATSDADSDEPVAYRRGVADAYFLLTGEDRDYTIRRVAEALVYRSSGA